MRTEATIRDIMNVNPVIVSRKATVMDAAKEMKGEGVGSIIIVDDGTPVGIVTESDILRKVVAEGKHPSEITVEEIMSSPPITVSPDAGVEEVIKLMGRNKIRRLPVMENGKLAGMVTERDLLQISPMLLDVARELASINEERETSYRKQRFLSGKCEGCGMLSDRLIEVDGHLFCESCAESYR
ncbi:MAG TPA: CBS domain-containing protein [Thermoplasmatales archaeon]|nr:MAG: CBS domain-containing protein [Thermoplasmata archaeon]HHH84275.1 CBS domain-containing protein [Thermoplasmatales archaeon]